MTLSPMTTIETQIETVQEAREAIRDLAKRFGFIVYAITRADVEQAWEEENIDRVLYKDSPVLPELTDDLWADLRPLIEDHLDAYGFDLGPVAYRNWERGERAVR